MSQLVALSLKGELVPIVIKVQQLQRRLLTEPDAFVAGWNYADVYLRLEHGADSAIYRFLRQAMASRRALLLIDGLDEGGTNRDEIEAHVAEVLAPQGHVMLCTSRPAGLDVTKRFAAFRHLLLSPLKEAQQQEALEQRLGVERAAVLLPYLRDTVPTDTETGQKVTSNPLMLSMVASVFELRQGIDMPKTVSELYAIASEAMLARGGAAMPQLTALLQRVFFEAHVAQQRVIEDRQLDEAALGMEAPEELRAIRERAEVAERAALDAAPLARYNGKAEVGHYVEVTYGTHTGKRGIVHEAHYVTFADGTTSGSLNDSALTSSGLDATEVLARAMVACAADVRAACDRKLSDEMREALRTVRERVTRDELPLLSLLQAEPLQLQASHLSFQEYFAARALCEEGTVLSGAPPWQWPAWWANAVKLGEEMGEPFARGLLRAAGVEGDALDLSAKLGGDRPTVLRVVVLFSAVLTSVDLSSNQLCGLDWQGKGTYDASGIIALSEALKVTAVLTSLDLFGNSIGAEEAKTLAEALAKNAVLTSLDLQGNEVGPDGAKALASALAENAALTSLDLYGNSIGAEGAKALAKALEKHAVLTSLNLYRNAIGAEGAKALAEALWKNAVSPAVLTSTSSTPAVLTSLDVGYNSLDDEGALGIVRAVRQHDKMTSLGLASCKIGASGAKEIAEYVSGTAVLTDLNLCNNNIGAEGAKAFAEALASGKAVLTYLNLRANDIGADGAKAIAAALVKNAVLKDLDLAQNALCGIDIYGRGTYDPSGIQALAAALSSGSAVLTSLNLEDNDIGAKGAKAIATALEKNAVFRMCDTRGHVVMRWHS